MNKCIVIGSLNYDIILKMDQLPEKGESMPVSGGSSCGGGKGANQAVQAAKLGIETYLAGCVGSDAMGDFLLNKMKEFGVKTDYIKVVPGSSGMAVVNALDNGDVYAAVVRGANFQITEAEVDRAAEKMAPGDWAVLQLEIPAVIVSYAICRAREKGCRIILNTAPALPLDQDIMNMCDVVIMNEVEAGEYMEQKPDSVEAAKRAALAYTRKHKNCCIITLGELGAVAAEAEAGSAVFIPPQRVEAADTTGAGDSFIGGLCYGFIHGMDLAEACSFATGCSAVTISKVGAQEAMPFLDELDCR